MFYNEVIKKGISYIRGVQNPDGGIPIGKKGDESGYWTTAESLEAILSTDYFALSADNICFALKMVRFLLDGFITNGLEGYWEGKSGSGASTMTTGHVIFSLTLCLNKVINSDLEIKIEEENSMKFATVRKDIQEAINKAILWLLKVKNTDDGWGPTISSDSNIVCCYYVLKAFSAIGKNADTDNIVYSTCILIKKNIQEVMKKRKYDLDGDDFASLLYGYMGLKITRYFRKFDEDFENRINRFIKINWKRLQQNVATRELASASKSFLNNLPWITLNTLLCAESYSYSKKINKLLNLFVKQQDQNGSWFVIKNEEKQTTWITAEMIIDFNLAQTRYEKYQKDIIFMKKYKMVIFANILLGILCIFSIFSYTWSCIIGNTTWYENSWNFVITLLGVISSIISILSIKIEL